MGAFTKKPSQGLIKQIKQNNLHYIVHKMSVKGTLYNKVLIGPFLNKTDANKQIKKVKKVLGKPSAYIIRLK